MPGHHRLQRPFLPVLVREAEVGHRCANLRSQPGDIDLTDLLRGKGGYRNQQDNDPCTNASAFHGVSVRQRSVRVTSCGRTRVTFLARPGHALFPLGPKADIVAPDLRAAADRIVAIEPR